MEHLIDIVTTPWIATLLVLFFTWEYLILPSMLWKELGPPIIRVVTALISLIENKVYNADVIWVKERSHKIQYTNFFMKFAFFIIALTIVLLIELFWELGFKEASGRFASSKIAKSMESWIRSLRNWQALVLFGIPFILMEIMGFASLAFFANGQFLFGVLLYIIKVLFFIPIHFVLHTAENQLMQIKWYKKRYDMLIAILDWFKGSKNYTYVHNKLEIVKGYILGIKEYIQKKVFLIRHAFNDKTDLVPNVMTKESTSIHNNIQEIQGSSGGFVEKEYYERFYHSLNQDHISKE